MDEVRESSGISGRNPFILSSDYSFTEISLGGCLERMAERGEFIKHDSDAPDIALFVIWFIHADLWR